MDLLQIAKVFFIPLLVAISMYIVVHLELLLIHRLFDIGLTHRLRTKIAITTFFSAYVAVFLLVLLKNYLLV